MESNRNFKIIVGFVLLLTGIWGTDACAYMRDYHFQASSPLHALILRTIGIILLIVFIYGVYWGYKDVKKRGTHT